MRNYFTTLGFAAAALAEKADIAVSVDEGLLTALTHGLSAELANAINTLQIEDQYFDGGYFRNIRLHTEPGTDKDLSLTTAPESNGFHLHAGNIVGKLTADYEVCGWFWICLWGSLEANISGHGIGINSDLDLSSFTTSQGHNLPKLGLENFEVSLQASDFDVETKKSMNAWLVDMTVGTVADIAEVILLPAVMVGINVWVPRLWNDNIHLLLEQYGGVFDLGFNHLGLEVDYAANPAVTAEHAQFFLNAVAIDQTTGEKKIKGDTPDLQLNQKSSNAVQFALAAESINSGAEILYEAGWFNIEMTNADAPDFLNTSFLDTEIKGFVKKFGSNQPVDLHISAIKTPEVSFTPADWTSSADFKLRGDFDFAFSVKGADAWTLRASDAEIKVHANVSGDQLSIGFDEIYIDTLSEPVNKLGFRHNPQSLADFIDGSSLIILPFVNAYIPKITLPSEVFGVHFSELVIAPKDNWVEFELAIADSSASELLE